MRIVYLANSAWPSLRGAERLMFALAAHGLSRGHEVTIVAPTASAIHAACAERGIRTEPARFGASLSHTARLRALLRELKPDIVHGMSIFPVAYVRELGLVPNPERVGYFADATVDPNSLLPVATPGPKRLGLAVRNAISRHEAPRLDAIFTAAETVSEGLELAGIRGRVLVNTGVIDTEGLEAAAATPFDFPAGGLRIGYAGYLEHLKGIDVLISAFARVAEAHPDTAVFIAGEGPERDSLAEQARRLGIADRVHLLGFVDPIAPFMAGLDLFVSPSRSEALARSILEAMALGTAVVCTRSGNQARYVTDGVSGLLVDADDVDALAAAMERAIADAALRESLASAGKQVATSAEFSEAASIERVFAEYQAALARRTKA